MLVQAGCTVREKGKRLGFGFGKPLQRGEVRFAFLPYLSAAKDAQHQQERQDKEGCELS